MITKELTVFGRALMDFHAEKAEHKLMLNTSYGEPEEMPLWYFFRGYEEMPPLEKMAISICDGRVLDVGAGTGSHAICLQQLQLEVTAIDTSQDAVNVMQLSNVKDARAIDYFQLKDEKYDTLLCLMNGLGFIGKLSRLGLFLKIAEELLKPEGQIIVDSSDVSYLFADNTKPTDRYYGEVSFQYEYKNQKGPWFDWVYIDKEALTGACANLGWNVQLLYEDENDQYLARISRIVDNQN